MKKYELWRSESEGSYTFFETSNDAVRSTLSEDADLVWQVEAADLAKARACMHEFLGWEPYVPSEDDAEELG